ncbi:acyltransferase family protein, partial [Streptomyces sp. NPDC059411]|uniref:acyltransferase family protein n=1 Tax=Streptomyces sp. NPDC059411 TaxID=3346825 RepID=UPI0036905A0B
MLFPLAPGAHRDRRRAAAPPTGPPASPSGSGESGPSPHRSAFRPDIEGLRALAVLAVLAFHAGIPGLAGGFVGVDVFFVVSGYLITGLLVREAVTTGRIRLLDFFSRRARRLLPSAAVVLAAVARGGGGRSRPLGRARQGHPVGARAGAPPPTA